MARKARDKARERPGRNGGTLRNGSKPGTNKGGTGRPPSDFTEQCRAYTPEALATCVKVMQTGRDSDRLKAAQWLLERGWGKAAQPLTDKNGESIGVISLADICSKIGIKPAD